MKAESYRQCVIIQTESFSIWTSRENHIPDRRRFRLEFPVLRSRKKKLCSFIFILLATQSLCRLYLISIFDEILKELERWLIERCTIKSLSWDTLDPMSENSNEKEMKILIKNSNFGNGTENLRLLMNKLSCIPQHFQEFSTHNKSNFRLTTSCMIIRTWKFSTEN